MYDVVVVKRWREGRKNERVVRGSFAWWDDAAEWAKHLASEYIGNDADIDKLPEFEVWQNDDGDEDIVGFIMFEVGFNDDNEECVLSCWYEFAY